MIKVLKVVGILLITALLGLAYWTWHPSGQNPSAAELSKEANNYQAEIIRDSWGVPHIVGDTNADTSFGLAYAHAEDDFETIQETVAATRGVIAQYRGKDAAPTDYMVQLMNVWPTLEREYKNIPNHVKSIAKAYAAGINLYAAENPGTTWRGLAPFTDKDVIAGFMFKTPFFYGLDKPVTALFEGKADLELALAPDQESMAWTVTESPLFERGSNAIAVAPLRSTDQKTRLLINSHQPMTGPVAWYEAHLHARRGWKIQGGLFPGTPVILHGFTPNLGWANTVNHIDLWDEYLIEVNPENPNQYKIDDQWVEFQRREITLLVKLFGNFKWPAKREVLRTVHGPVIESQGQLIALRYAGMGEVNQLEQYIRLNQANDFEDFMAAMELQYLPSINYVYGDKAGNVAFIHNAQYPKRSEGWDWSKVMPGNKSELIWRGYRPFREVPKLVNPKSGLVFNANNTPFSATDGPDNLQSSEFPESMGLASNQTNRSQRLIELNDGVTLISEEELLRQKFDVEYSVNSKFYKSLKNVIELDLSEHSELQEPQDIIRDWDRKVDIPNRNAAMAISVLREFHHNDSEDDSDEEVILAALKGAREYLLANYGSLQPEWGEVNRLKRGDFNQAVSGGPDVLRAIYSRGHDADERAYATAGDTWMALVSWDADGQQEAKVLHQFGSATLDETSKHYADQAALFVKEQWREATFDIEKIRSQAANTYNVGTRAPK